VGKYFGGNGGGVDGLEGNFSAFMNWGLLQNSLIVAAGATVLATLWGLAVALFAGTLGTRARKGVVVLAIVAFALPPFLVTNTWLHYFGLAGTLRPYVPFELFSRPGTILLIALQLWPIAFLFTSHGLSRMDRAYLEMDPLFAGQTMINHVVWPSIRAGFWQSGAITFVLALNNFSVPALLQTKVYAAEVWLSFTTQFNYWEALRLSWPLILGPLLLLALLRRRKLTVVFRHSHFPSRLFRDRLGPVRHAAALSATMLIVISVLLPLFQLAVAPRTWTELSSAIAAGRSATFNSLIFAFGSAALIILFSLRLQRTKLPFLFWLFFLAPGVLLGIALIWSFNRPLLGVFYGSVGIVLLAYTVRFLAFGWSGVRLASAWADPAPLDVVRAFGGSRWQQFRLAVWPRARHLIAATFVLIYLMCLWEVETLIMIVPPGRETLALRVFNMLHYGHAGQVNALCVWLLAVALAPLLLALAGQRIIRFLVPVWIICALGCAPAQESTGIKSELFGSVEVIGSRGTGPGQFNKPRALTVDRDYNLYVVDMTGRVQKFSPDGRYVLAWQMPETDKGKPKGMTGDARGNIVVIEPHYSRVNHFDAAGHLVAQWGVHGTNTGQLMFPRAAAINSRGEIYLSEYGLVERVLRFTDQGETFLNVIGSGGIAPGEFNRPEGLGVGPGDKLYVADSCNHRVQIFSREGQFLESFGAAGSAVGEMSYPYDVRVDSSGLIFVCEFGNSRVQIFDQENRSVGMVGEAGGEPGRMHNPWSIALDARGNLYVADSGNHRVQKFLRREPLVPLPPATTALSNVQAMASAAK
jgi:ABC-type Fe3+ transport system permease subunit/sugar lactone lactonase YvrE